MTSIDLYDDFNEEGDQLMGDREEEDNQNEEDGPENTSSTKQDVDHGIKVVKVKRKLVTLNVERLKGPRGIIAVDDFFTDVKLKGRGYEKDDLKEIMKRMEHWAHRLFPKYHFDDTLAKIERLGRKKEIAIHMTRYRMGQLIVDDDDQKIIPDDDNDIEKNNSQEMPFDEFDQLLDQQIALSTSALPSTTFGNISSISGFSQIPQSSHINQSTSFSSSQQPPQQSQQSQQKVQLSDEQKARIEENKKRAMALREARLKQQEEELSLKRQKEEDEQKKSTSQVFSDLLFDDDFV